MTRVFRALTIAVLFGACTTATTPAPPAGTPTGLLISPAVAQLAAGSELQLQVLRVSEAGSEDITPTITAWTSTDDAIARVDLTSGMPILVALAAGSITLTAEAPGDEGSATASVTVTDATASSLTLTPPAPQLAEGTRTTVRATATFSDSTTQDVSGLATWSTDDPTVATVGAAGEVSAVGVGGAMITATFAGHSASAAITVTAGTLQAIVVGPPDPVLVPGLGVQLAATGIFGPGAQQDITGAVSWTSDAMSVADVDSSGRVTAAMVGNATITATDAATMVFGSVTVTVTAAVLTAIQITPTAPRVATGTSLQLLATGVLDDGSTQDLTTAVTWSSDAMAVADVGPTTGLLDGVAAGNATISADHAASGLSAMATATVVDAALIGLFVTPGQVTTEPGLPVQFTATGVFADASLQDLTTQVAWSSADDLTAAIDAATGVATGVQPGGPITLTATSPSGPTATADMTLTAPTLIDVQIFPGMTAVPLGLPVQYAAAGLNSNGTTVDLTTMVTWDSSNMSVATIDAAGLALTAGVGTTNISLDYLTGTFTDSVQLQTTAVELVAMSLVPTATAPVPLGRSLNFRAVGVFSDGTTADVTAATTFAGDDDTTLEVLPDGTATALAQGGPVNVTATHNTSPVGTGAAYTVGPPVVIAIEITPEVVSLTDAQMLQLGATGHFSDGSSSDVTSSVTWMSSDDMVVTVDSSGLLTGVAFGRPVITATHPNGVSAGKSGYVLDSTIPAMTADASLSTLTPLAGELVTLTVPVTANARSVNARVTTLTGTNISNSATTTVGMTQPTIVVPLNLSCTTVGQATVTIDVRGASTSDRSEYRRDASNSTVYYEVRQRSGAGGNEGDLLTTFQVLYLDVGPPAMGTCDFPNLISGPTPADDPVNGGVATAVSGESDIALTIAQSSFFDTIGALIGSGTQTASGTMINVPTPTSCLSTATTGHPALRIWASTLSSEYRFLSSISTTELAVRRQDSNGTGPWVASGIALPAAVTWNPGMPTCIPTMTAAPTPSVAMVAAGGSFTVDVPFVPAAGDTEVGQVSISLQTTTGFGFGGSGSVTNATMSPATVTVNVPAGTTPGVYAIMVGLQAPGFLTSSSYFRDFSGMSSNYQWGPWDGFVSLNQPTMWALATVTVTP